MSTLYSIIVALQTASGSNAKIAILNENKNDSFLKEFIRVVYEPRINLYMRKIDLAKGNTLPIREFTKELLHDIVLLLNERRLTGNEARNWVAEINTSLDDPGKALLKLLIDRDLRAGMTGNTANKVWPGLVTDVPYMRCSLSKDVTLSSWPWHKGVLSQIKLDGMFCNITRTSDKNVVISSRSGSPFPLDAFSSIVDDVLRHVPPGYQMHGELLVARKRMSGYEVLPRQEGNGMLNSILQGGSLENDYVIMYEAWDLIPERVALPKGSHNVPYLIRFELLKNSIANCNVIRLVETKKVTSLQEAYNHYRDALARGLEGTIVKHPEMPWEDKTSKFQIKLKLEKTVDLRITGFTPGNGKYVNLFGSISCESEDGKLKVNVSGFSDKERMDIYAKKDDLIGTIIEVVSNSIMPPTNKDYYSLFLPRFSELRSDKNCADSIERIQAIFEAIDFNSL